MNRTTRSTLLAGLLLAPIFASAENIPASPSKDAVCHVRWPDLLKQPGCKRNEGIFDCTDRWIRKSCKVGDVLVWYDHNKGVLGLSYNDGHDHFEKFCSVLDMRVLATGERACRIATMPAEGM